jgi:putative hydrolase of the HAD superfamily
MLGSDMSDARYTAWLLDFDGTLYRPSPVKLWMGLELLLFGAAHLRTLRSFRHEHERIRREQEHEVEDPFQLQIQRTATKLGLDPQRVARIVEQWMFERPQKWIRRHARAELVHEVHQFRSRGGKLAVVSDYPVSAKLKAIQPELVPDVIVASGEHGGPGRLKPYPDGYLKAAHRLDLAPERCLVIGDRQDADGLAAERAGMGFRLIK